MKFSGSESDYSAEDDDEEFEDDESGSGTNDFIHRKNEFFLFR